MNLGYRLSIEVLYPSRFGYRTLVASVLVCIVENLSLVVLSTLNSSAVVYNNVAHWIVAF